jgi:hypothetical protein
MCTSLIETSHFLFVIVVLPSFFADDAIICLANYGRLCTFESEHLYFPMSIHALLALILLYFHLDDFIMFLALLREICISKTEHLCFLESLFVLSETEYLYFPLLLCVLVLSRVMVHTSSIYWKILLLLQPFTGTLYFPKLKLCTFCRHCVLLIITMCTFISYFGYFPSDDFYYTHHFLGPMHI